MRVRTGIGNGRQDEHPQTVKKSRLQIALVCLLLAGAGLLAVDRCAGEASVGQATYLGNEGGSGSGTGSGSSGGGIGGPPPDWDPNVKPLTPERLDSIYRTTGMTDSLRERLVENYRRSLGDR